MQKYKPRKCVIHFRSWIIIGWYYWSELWNSVSFILRGNKFEYVSNDDHYVFLKFGSAIHLHVYIVAMSKIISESVDSLAGGREWDWFMHQSKSHSLFVCCKLSAKLLTLLKYSGCLRSNANFTNFINIIQQCQKCIISLVLPFRLMIFCLILIEVRVWKYEIFFVPCFQIIK